MSQQEVIDPDAFHRHEALDRSYICMDMVDRLLLEHPAIEENNALKEKIAAAHALLFEVYQEIAARHL